MEFDKLHIFLKDIFLKYYRIWHEIGINLYVIMNFGLEVYMHIILAELNQFDL